MKLIVRNKKAHYNYFLDSFIEVGIELKGTEVKSIYLGNVRIDDAYITFHKNEAYIINMHIAKYEFGNIWNLETDRKRKLLLHKKEIVKLEHLIKKDSLTIVPTKIYFKNGKIKLEIATGKGKKLFDKREVIKKRDSNREVRN